MHAGMCDYGVYFTSFLWCFLFYAYACLRDSQFDDRGDAVYVHSILPANGMEVNRLFERYRCITDTASLNLFLFARNFRVIVYDRFGMHEKEVKSLLKLPGVDYYPFTG